MSPARGEAAACFIRVYSGERTERTERILGYPRRASSKLDFATSLPSI